MGRDVKLRCFCGRLMGHVNRVGEALEVTTWQITTARSPARPVEELDPGPVAVVGPRRHPFDETSPEHTSVLELDGDLWPRCPRHGEVHVTGAELDRSLRHRQTVHRARPN
jgi:hypothetical protein